MENKLVADKWLTVWKFNDEHATMFAKKNRCFTLWDKFNPEQEKQIKQYMMYTLPVLPIYDNHFNMLVVGDKEEPRKYHDRYLEHHPFYDLSERKDGNGKSAKIHVYEYQSLNITKTSKKPTPENFKVHYTNDDTINICDEDQQRVNSELQRLKDLITKTEITLQNNIFFCHCMSCIDTLQKYFDSHLQHKHCLTYIIDEVDADKEKWKEFVNGEMEKRPIRGIVPEGKLCDHFDSKLLMWLYGLGIGNQLKVVKDKCCGPTIALFCETKELGISLFNEHVKFSRPSYFIPMLQRVFDNKAITGMPPKITSTFKLQNLDVKYECYKLAAGTENQISLCAIYHGECNTKEKRDDLAKNVMKGTLEDSSGKKIRVHGVVCLVKPNEQSEFIKHLLPKIEQDCKIPVFVIMVSTTDISEDQIMEGNFQFFKFQKLHARDYRQSPGFRNEFRQILSASADYKTKSATDVQTH